METQIVPVAPQEIEAFLDICGEFYAAVGAPFEREISRQNAEILLQNPEKGRAVWLLVGEERAGYLIFTFSWGFEFGAAAILEHLFVREEFRRRGVGEAAIAWAESACAAEGISTLLLGVENANERAQALYCKREWADLGMSWWAKFLA